MEITKGESDGGTSEVEETIDTIEVINGDNKDKIEDDKNEDNELIISEDSPLKPSGGSEDNGNDQVIYGDNIVWDNQMFPKPRDFKV